MSWCFAMVNKSLAEIYFENGRVWGHCLVRSSDYKTKREWEWIKKDTEKYKLRWVGGKYSFLKRMAG